MKVYRKQHNQNNGGKVKNRGKRNFMILKTFSLALFVFVSYAPLLLLVQMVVHTGGRQVAGVVSKWRGAVCVCVYMYSKRKSGDSSGWGVVSGTVR